MPGRVAVQRLPNVPFRFGQVLEQVARSAGERRRHDSFRQQSQPGAALVGLLLRCFFMASPMARRELVPGASLAKMGHRLRPIWIVERQAPMPGDKCRWRRGWPDDRDCLQSSLGVPCGFPPAGRRPRRRGSSWWRRRAACPARLLPAAARRAPRSTDGAGCTLQPLKPARAIEAPMRVRNLRRLSASGQSVGLSRKFAAHQFLKCLAAGEFLQAAPGQRGPWASPRRRWIAVNCRSRLFRVLMASTSDFQPDWHRRSGTNA